MRRSPRVLVPASIVNKSTKESMNADDNARARFLHDINGIRHLALNWETWLRSLGPYPPRRMPCWDVNRAGAVGLTQHLSQHSKKNMEII
jgi:hypothetical protein